MKNITITSVFLLVAGCLLAAPLSLAQCRQMALDHNQSVRAAQERTTAAADHQRSAFTHFLPRVSAEAVYQQMHNDLEYKTPDLALPVADAQGNIVIVTDPSGNPVLDPNGNPIVQNWALLPSQTLKIGNTHNYLAAVTVTQPLFTGGKLLEQYKTAGYEKNSVMESERLTRQQVVYQTDQRYWQVVSLKEKVDLATSYQATVQAHVTDLQNYREEGFITDNDLLKAQVKLEQANLTVLQATNGLTLATMALNQLLGNDLDAALEVADSLTTSQNHIPDASGTKSRPEIALLQNGIKTAASLQRISISRYLPNIALEGSYLWANPNPYNSFADEFGDDWTIGVVAQWDIFHWNERGFDTAAIAHQKRALQYQLDELDELTDLEIHQARQQVNEDKQAIVSANKAVTQAQKNLTMYQDRFSEGLATSTDVLDAQTLWLETRSSLIEAQTNLQLHYTALAKAMGSL